MSAMPRILVVRLAALGDVVMASAVLQRIRAELPGAHVTWLCGEAAAAIVRLFEGVDEVLTVDDARIFRGNALVRGLEIGRLWARLARRRFDRVLLGHPDPRYRALVPVRRRKVHAFRRGPHNPMPLPGRFAGDEFARLLDPSGSHDGPIVGHWPIADVRPRLPRERVLPSSPAGGLIGLVPGGARNILRDDALRRWPVERYAALARTLLAAGHRVVLIGDAGDAWVRPHFEGLAVLDRLGALSLTGTLAALRDCDLVVAHDTGPMHLARLVRAPTIALFGPTNPRERLVEDGLTFPLWGGADLACRPCYDGRSYAACRSNVCIQEITAEAVARLAEKILGDRAARPDAARAAAHVTQEHPEGLKPG